MDMLVVWLRFLIWFPIQTIFWLAFHIVAIPIGAVVVLVYLLLGKVPPWIWRNKETGPYSSFKGRWWWYAGQNPVAGLRYMISEPPKADLKTYGATDSMDKVTGFQWRYRHSRWMDSLRLSWGKSDPHSGKDELYVGPKIGSETPGVGIALSWRPAWMPARCLGAIGVIIWVF